MTEFENNIQNLVNTKSSLFIRFGIKVLLVIVCFIIGHKLIEWVRKLVRRSMERANTDAGIRQFADSLLKYGLHIMLVVVIANSLGIESTSMAALVASGGMTISLALQGSLSNLAGGILILTLKPFVVGDYIIEDTHKNEGTVKEIQIFYTKLATIDNKTIVIPNGALANNSMTNVTAKEFRQLDLRVDISYDADLKKAKRLLQEILEKDASVISDKEKNVFVDNLGESSVVMGLRAWVKTEEYWESRWRILENVKLILDENHIEIPYNQLQIHLDK